MVIHDRKGQNSEGHAPQRLTQRLDRAQQTTNHTQHARRSARCWPACSYVARGVGATSPLARVVAAGFDSRPGLLDVIIRVHLSVGFSLVPYVYVCCHGLLLLARSRSTASRSSTLCGCSLVHALLLLSRPRTAYAPPRSYTPCGSSLVHALWLPARTRSAAPRSSTLCRSSLVHALRLRRARRRSRPGCRSSSYAQSAPLGPRLPMEGRFCRVLRAPGRSPARCPINRARLAKFPFRRALSPGTPPVLLEYRGSRGREPALPQPPRATPSLTSF